MNEKFDPDKFTNYMKEQAKIIREQELDKEQILKVYNNMNILFLDVWEKYGSIPIKDINTFSEAIFEFNLALEIAFSNYRRANKNMWASIFGWGTSKIPSLDLNELVRKKQ